MNDFKNLISNKVGNAKPIVKKEKRFVMRIFTCKNKKKPFVITIYDKFGLCNKLMIQTNEKKVWGRYLDVLKYYGKTNVIIIDKIDIKEYESKHIRKGRKNF